LVDLAINLTSTSTFVIGSNIYKVNKKGFFSPVYTILHKEEKVLTLSHSFWGSEGRIVFNDGSVYACNYKNKGGLKIRFMDGEHEILTYGRIMENKKSVPYFSIGISMIDADKLLVLAALGSIMLHCLFSENSVGDEASTLLIMTAS
jgi:hypothetical protein